MNGLRQSSIVFLMLVGLLACSESNESSLPDMVLPQNEMAIVLADIQLVESTVKVNRDKELLKGDSLNAYNEVFSKNETTKAEFDSSMSYYTNHPLLLEEIYEQVIVILSEKLANYEGRVNEKTEP